MFAIFAFVGFESAATLGKETRDPTTTIPKAINWTAIAAGLFFIFTSYVIMMGFDDDATKLAASSAPLADILTGKSPVNRLRLFRRGHQFLRLRPGFAQRFWTHAVLDGTLSIRAQVDGHGAWRPQHTACRPGGRRGH